jgi:ribonucleoside-diphosphate reductase alpha chain
LFGSGHPYDAIKWELRTARITKSDGKVVFEQKDIEVPNFWTQTATDIVASKYFRGRLDAPERERSVKEMIDRIVKTIGAWGLQDGYFATSEDAERYMLDLTYLLVNQYFSFNSPVWFNVGIHKKPQCSACFILSVDDDTQSIFDWYRDEGWIFKFGSGAGTNLSKLRSSHEPLSRGGFASGPVSFMKGADGIANAIRSGGTTRRAAKMVALNVDHPDIRSFIYAKKIIEDMSKVLVQNGFANTIDGDLFTPYTILPYQNANNSVRVTDEFMQAVENDGMWNLTSRTTGETLERVRAREIMDWIADAAWHSADPGMQYDTMINTWHTCSNTGRINASNPCSEYMHLDNSACNLASLNLLKFMKMDHVQQKGENASSFQVELFRRAVDAIIIAQDIVVDNSSYPTQKIADNAHNFRELGMGYANLGALLMMNGLPYDSDAARLFAAQITSLMCGEAYRMSALLAQTMAPFAGYDVNREPMLNVLAMHMNEAEKTYLAAMRASVGGHELNIASRMVWHETLELARKYGVRNSQATVLAPTGTIAFMMDCDTTGVEPSLALVSYKKLVGGGTLKLVNNQVPAALQRLGYTDQEIDDISASLLERATIEGAPHLKEEHLPIFDCSFKAANGERCISYMGHLKMMSAIQPFISGAISKTINMPHDATVEDIRDAYLQGWKLGLKAVAIYRDGSKSVQPLSTKKEDDRNGVLVEKQGSYMRIKLPDERPALTHKFSVGGYEGYLTVGLYPETQKPGETFLVAAKEGSTVSGLLDTIATLISMCLQSGIPLKTLVRKFKDVSFSPAGFTSNPEIPTAKSIIDYMFRYIGIKFLDPDEREELFGPSHAIIEKSESEISSEDGDAVLASLASLPISNHNNHAHPIPARASNADAPVCQCGTLMFKAGSCYSCPNCFATTGVCN